MELKNLGLSFAVIAVLSLLGGALGGVTLSKPVVVEKIVEKVVETKLAGASTEHFFTENFLAGFTYGGQPCTATSTTAAVGTLMGTGDSTLADPSTSCINFTVNIADVTLTLAASTSGWYPKAVNESKRLFIRNASTTASADILLAAGTGINLKGVATTTDAGATWKVIVGDTGAANYAIIDFIKQSDTDIDALVTTFRD